jgi:hypothetical protein
MEVPMNKKYIGGKKGIGPICRNGPKGTPSVGWVDRFPKTDSSDGVSAL